MAKTSSLLAIRLTGSGSALASTSRNAAAAFSTSARSCNDTPREDVTARKSPYSASSEAMPAEQSRDAEFVPRGRKAAGRGRPAMLPPYQQWITTGGMAFKYPKPGMGPNWIGKTPFPLNPSFDPPPPIRQSTKTEIWKLHARNPKEWTIRALSEHFSIGIPRMEAILRLKALEEDWVAEKTPLQSDFQSNMDRLLGAQDRTRVPEPKPATQTKDGSMRGVQYEEFSDSEPLTTPHVLGPAIAAEMESRKKTVSELHTGEPHAGSRSKFVRSSNTKRASLQVISVPSTSYQGAGTVEKNKKQAAKRKLQRELEASKVKGTAKPTADKPKVTFKGIKITPEVRSKGPNTKPKVTPKTASKVAPAFKTELK